MPCLRLFISNPNNRTDIPADAPAPRDAMPLDTHTIYQIKTANEFKNIHCYLHGSDKWENATAIDIESSPRKPSLTKDSIGKNAYLTNDVLFDEFELVNMYFTQPITSVKFFVDENEIPVIGTPIEQSPSSVRCRLKYHLKTNSSRILLHHFGLIQLVFLIHFQNDQTEIWHSKFVQVYHRTDPQKYTENHIASAGRMIQYLMNHDSNFLDLKQDLALNTLPDEIRELESVYNILEKQLPFFVSAPATQATRSNILGDIHHMRGLNNHTSAFTATHSQYLMPSPSGIPIAQNLFATPKKLLIPSIHHDYDLLENRAILAFFNSTSEFIATLIHRYADITNNQQYQELISMLPKPPQNLTGYLTNPDSSGCIQALFKNRFSAGLAQLKNLLTKFLSLRLRYEQALHLNASTCGTLKNPKMMNHKHIVFLSATTPAKLKSSLIFRDRVHYRILFNLINDCLIYSYRKHLEPSEVVARRGELDNIIQLMQLPSTDKLYEYYCLTNMLNILNNHPKLELLSTLNFQYRASDSPLNPLISKSHTVYSMYVDTNCPNSWVFASLDKTLKITLYYQPIIHNQVELSDVNGIQLRTIQGHSLPIAKRPYAHYTPDFIIKFERKQKVAYCIIDSKWKLAGPPPNKENAYEDIAECYFKYIQSMGTITPKKNCISQGNNIEGLWLLAGKNHYPKMTDSNFVWRSKPNPKPLAHTEYTDTLNFGCGVVPLTPETVEREDGEPKSLTKIFSDMIFEFLGYRQL